MATWPGNTGVSTPVSQPAYGGPTTRLANHSPDKAETAAAVSANTGIPARPFSCYPTHPGVPTTGEESKPSELPELKALPPHWSMC